MSDLPTTRLWRLLGARALRTCPGRRRATVIVSVLVLAAAVVWAVASRDRGGSAADSLERIEARDAGPGGDVSGRVRP